MAPRVGYLGPPGTFGEEALLTQPDLAEGELVPMRSMPEVLAAVEAGDLDLGFVAIENAIDGTVNITQDALIFERELLIQREVELPVRMSLMAPPGTTLADVRRVLSIPVAIAQCRGFFASMLPGVDEVAANSTAEAARLVGEAQEPGTAAVGPALAAKLYGLDVLASAIEDHPDNATRFVLVARDGIPAPTGHDKTSIVCFQRDDHPGALHEMLGPFSARAINMTKLESRTTKHRLGKYCFIIDFEGHVADPVVADCLRDLHVQLADLKFLGSYPRAGEQAVARRRRRQAAWKAADEWLDSLRTQVRGR